MLIERTATGGQAGQSSRIENYLGFPDGLSGAQLAERARRQAEKFEAELITAARGRRTGNRRIGADGASVATAAPSARTGGDPGDGRRVPPAARRGLCDGLTGRRRLLRRDRLGGLRCDDEEVYVIGGANSAGQAAMYLSRTAKSVTLLVRGAARWRTRCRTT